MIKVFHFPSALFRFVPHGSAEKQAAFALQHFTKYKHVADVDTASLEQAFRLTNSIDNHWSLNHGVKHYETSRSTSVGDVMEQDGKFYVVASFGFTEITLDSEAAT
jgi:hypothetical protein